MNNFELWILLACFAFFLVLFFEFRKYNFNEIEKEALKEEDLSAL